MQAMLAQMRAEAEAGLARERNPRPLDPVVEEELRQRRVPIERYAYVDVARDELLAVLEAIDGAGLADQRAGDLLTGVRRAKPRGLVMILARDAMHVCLLAEKLPPEAPPAAPDVIPAEDLRDAA